MLIPAAPKALAQYVVKPSRHHAPLPSSHPAVRSAVHPTATVTPEGTWTPLVNPVPENVGLMMLLTDGTVIASGNNAGGDGGIDNTWYKLTPDGKGSYVNGTWSQLTSMQYTRLYVESQILQSGKVYVSGGEYGNAPKGSGELYDPIANTWTALPNTTSIEPNASWIDGESMLLPNGNVLAYSVGGQNCSAGGYYTGDLFIYNVAANSYSLTGCPIENQDETSWVKLPDNSILGLDLNTGGNAETGPTSERYFPSTGQWVADAVPPVYLFNANGELGGAFLLPNGKVFYIGGTNQTLIYTPSGTTALGTWVQGPTFPDSGGAPTGANDAPAAMMINGKILMAEGGYVNPPCDYCAPTYFFVYDYQTNTISSIAAPDGTASLNASPFTTDMLDLPDGSILFEGASTQLYTFKPNSAQVQTGEPVLNSIQLNQDGSYLLTGTGFNGISMGADYGDENQNATNYPIAKLTDSSGNVYYGRTYNWSSTGVDTGNEIVTTDMTVPAAVPHGIYTLTVSANGVSSDPTQATSVFCYLCQVATPTFMPGGGTYATAQSVKILDATAGATIYYTTNGATPTTGSTVYSTPISVTSTETIKAIAAVGTTTGAPASATYTITPAKIGTTTTLSANPNSNITVGEKIVLTIVVTPNSGTAIPAGTVTLASNNTKITSTVNLDATGKAVVNVTAPAKGMMTLFATYNGSTTDTTSVSATLSVVVH